MLNSMVRVLKKTCSKVKKTSITTPAPSIECQHEPNHQTPHINTRNILITAALPYVNNTPHLGNIIGGVLSADIYARYCRLRGYNTLFVSGTDEYGTTTEVKALQQGTTPTQICNRYHNLHTSIYKWFNISCDSFGRTSTHHHTQLTHEIFTFINKNGYIYTQTAKQFYCGSCKISLADRYVKGTCFKCGSKNAKGDQCDDCSTLFKDPFVEVLQPKCAICGSTPEIRDSEHLYFSTTKLKDALNGWLELPKSMAQWSHNAKSVTKAWMKGLQDRCISRDLTWGVPVPKHVLENKVFYVWFQAPLGYVSMTKSFIGEQWRKWWQPDEKNVELCQFMGKDNIVFHSIITPAAFFANGQSWVFPRRLSVTQYLMYEGGKFSKSRGIGVFGHDCKDTGIPSDVWRYYLATNRPEHFDTEFTWEGLITRNNKDLVNSLGNLFNRVIKYVHKQFKGQVPQVNLEQFSELERKLLEDLGLTLTQYFELMEKVEIKAGVGKVLQYSHILNKYLQDSQFWNKNHLKTKRTDLIIGLAIRCLNLYRKIIFPFLPVTSAHMAKMLGVSEKQPTITSQNISELVSSGQLPNLLQISPYILFQEINEQKIQQFSLKYGQNDKDK